MKNKKVKINEKDASHGFKIGEIVTIILILTDDDGDYYLAKNDEGEQWYIKSDEFYETEDTNVSEDNTILEELENLSNVLENLTKIAEGFKVSGMDGASAKIYSCIKPMEAHISDIKHIIIN